MKPTLPFASGISIDAVPTVEPSGDNRIKAGLLLCRCTVTPPCCAAPSCPEKLPYCSPDPTETGNENSVIPGTTTLTGCVDEFAAVKPGAVTLT